MKNFKKETLDFLKSYGKSIKDIEYIVVSHGSSSTCPKELTFELDKKFFFAQWDFNYNNSYGTSVIRLDLKLVGKDFWIERHEYDGSEWWEFKQKPKKPKKVVKQFVRE